jgi:hypothetical protein
MAVAALGFPVRRIYPARGASARAVVGGVLLCGALLLAAYLYVPKTTVILYPPTQPVAETLEVRADPAALAVDVSGRRIPARVGYVVTDVVEQSVTLGRLPDPNARAVGTVTVANRLGGAVTAPAGTMLATASGVRFTTTVDAVFDGTVGQIIRVPVQASDPGPTGNVARLEIGRVLGPLAGRLAVLNEEPTVGGGQSSTPVIVDADVDRARAAAADRARMDALSDLRAQTGADEMLLADSLESTIVEDSLDHKVGDLATTFTYRLRARFTAARIGADDLRQVVRDGWKPAIPSGYFLPEQQLEIGAPKVKGRDKGTVVLAVPVRSLAVAWIDAQDVRARARWRDPDETRRELARTLPSAAEPRVVVQPAWAGRSLRVDVALDLNPPNGASSQKERG